MVRCIDERCGELESDYTGNTDRSYVCMVMYYTVCTTYNNYKQVPWDLISYTVNANNQCQVTIRLQP